MRHLQARVSRLNRGQRFAKFTLDRERIRAWADANVHIQIGRGWHKRRLVRPTALNGANRTLRRH